MSDLQDAEGVIAEPVGPEEREELEEAALTSPDSAVSAVTEAAEAAELAAVAATKAAEAAVNAVTTMAAVAEAVAAGEDSKGESDEDEPAEDEGDDAGDEGNPRLRWALFNGSAAATGILVVWSVTGDPLAGVDLMARMTASVPQVVATGITLGAAVAGGKAARFLGLHRLPGAFGLGLPLAAAIGGATWGAGTATIVRDAMYAVEPWGSDFAPLLVAGPVAAACWWALDRRVSKSVWLWRWLARIPLATVVFSSLYYAPGVAL